MSFRTFMNEQGEVVIPDPPLAYALFNTVQFAWLWLILRLYLAYVWLSAALGKFSNPAWMDGTALRGFWTNAVSLPETGKPLIVYDWYRNLIQTMLENGLYTWFADLVAYSEFTVGLLLLLGAFTGIAAFAGAFLNWNFLMAGTASVNPMMLILSILLVLAWKVAGWYGLDRWLLPALGTPWTRRVREERVPTMPARNPEPDG
ncbi:MAG TPA: DoxX family membrane protein [Anaerolineales bacterium]|nr:DoxX family membrane protein [Anaerolineales bacterium]